MWGRRASLVLALSVALAGCEAAGVAAPLPSRTVGQSLGATASPSSAPTATTAWPAVPPQSPGATPPTATAQPINLDWVHGQLPRGLVLCEAGCKDAWGFWPVFGGLAFGFGTRWRWSTDGTRWQVLNVPRANLDFWSGGWLQSDGTDAGAFAYAADAGRWRLWRTVDRGGTWREVTGVKGWPDDLQLVAGAGRFLALSDDLVRLGCSSRTMAGHGRKSSTCPRP